MSLHRYLAAAAILVAAGCLAACTSSSGTPTTEAYCGGNTTTFDLNRHNYCAGAMFTPSPRQSHASTSPSSSAAAEPPEYKVGQRLIFGGFRVVVTSIRLGLSSVQQGAGLGPVHPHHGQFILVALKAKNVSYHPLDWTGQTILYDSKGRQFDEAPTGDYIYVPHLEWNQPRIQPDVTQTVWALYDLPRTVTAVDRIALQAVNQDTLQAHTVAYIRP